jgi:hypothetical protein
MEHRILELEARNVELEKLNEALELKCEQLKAAAHDLKRMREASPRAGSDVQEPSASIYKGVKRDLFPDDPSDLENWTRKNMLSWLKGF